MPSGARIKEPQALQDLRVALEQFAQTATAALQKIDAEMTKTLEWLGSRERHWQAEVASSQRALDAAVQAYEACMASGRDSDGRPPNCGAYAAAVNAARVKLEKAQNELNSVVVWKSKLNEAASYYLMDARHFRKLANEVLKNAGAFLQKKYKELNAYQDANEGGAATSSDDPFTAAIDEYKGHGPEFQTAKQEMLQRALNDPNTPRHIKGWIRQEMNRLENIDSGNGYMAPGGSRYLRMPPGMHAGHRIPGWDTAANLRLEDGWMNMHRVVVARRVGIFDRIR